jgi:hypothetical protein
MIWIPAGVYPVLDTGGNDCKKAKWKRKPCNMVKRYRKIVTDAKEKNSKTKNP